MFIYALLFASALISVAHGNQPCLGAPQFQHAFAASPESCDAYIICMNGQTIHGQRCPPGFLFEAVSQTCSSSTCMNCSPFGLQNLPHPQSCNQYIQCSMGVRTIRECGYGLNFDRNIGYCNRADLVECVDDPSITTTQPPLLPPTTAPPGNELPTCFADGLYHPHPWDCSRFYICISFNLWEQECPQGFHWNRSKEICDTPQAAECTFVAKNA